VINQSFILGKEIFNQIQVWNKSKVIDVWIIYLGSGKMEKVFKLINAKNNLKDLSSAYLAIKSSGKLNEKDCNVLYRWWNDNFPQMMHKKEAFSFSLNWLFSQKKMEKRDNNFKEVFFCKSDNGIEIEFNEKFCELLGLEKLNETQKTKIQQCSPPSSIPQM
jgi:hypothetical protein